MEDKITLDKQTLKALIVDTRLDILKLLNSKKYTQSELSELLKLSKPTVKDHLKILEDANLIKKEDTKRKWKYYSITFKGKKIVAPNEVNVMFAFLINAVAFVGVGLFTFLKFLTKPKIEADLMMASRAVPEAMMAKTADVAFETAQTTAPILPSWFYYVLILGILALSASFMLGYLLKRKVVIIKA